MNRETPTGFFRLCLRKRTSRGRDDAKGSAEDGSGGASGIQIGEQGAGPVDFGVGAGLFEVNDGRLEELARLL